MCWADQNPYKKEPKTTKKATIQLNPSDVRISYITPARQDLKSARKLHITPSQNSKPIYPLTLRYYRPDSTTLTYDDDDDYDDGKWHFPI